VLVVQFVVLGLLLGGERIALRLRQAGGGLGLGGLDGVEVELLLRVACLELCRVGVQLSQCRARVGGEGALGQFCSRVDRGLLHLYVGVEPR
jgi:hypothetical protein